MKKHELNTAWQRKWIALSVTDPTVQEMAAAAEEYCRRWLRNDPRPGLLVLCGNAGTGKTAVARRVAAYCRAGAEHAFASGCWGTQHKPSVCFLKWPEVVAEIRERNRSSLADAFGAELVVVDDVGAEADPWKDGIDAFCQILSRRERKFTVVTTNLSPCEWATKLDMRICDRLMRNSQIVDLTAVASYVRYAENE